MMPIPAPHVAIVILNWNRCADTLACLDSVFHLRYPNYRVLLIDNASTDDTVAQVQTHFPQVQVIVNRANLGFAAGNNVGIRAALQQGAEYILLLNNDTEIEADLLTRLVESADGGVAIPKICYHADRQRIWSAGAQWRNWPPRVTIIGLNQMDDTRFNQPRDLDYATGCAMLMHRTVLEQVGLLDESFFMYQEDYEFCYRVRQAGFVMRYVPTAIVWHKVSVSTGENSPQKWRLWSESIVTFYRKRYRWYYAPLLSFVVWVIGRELSKGNIKILLPLLQGLSRGMCLRFPKKIYRGVE